MAIQSLLSMHSDFEHGFKNCSSVEPVVIRRNDKQCFSDSASVPSNSQTSKNEKVKNVMFNSKCVRRSPSEIASLISFFFLKKRLSADCQTRTKSQREWRNVFGTRVFFNSCQPSHNQGAVKLARSTRELKSFTCLKQASTLSISVMKNQEG